MGGVPQSSYLFLEVVDCRDWNEDVVSFGNFEIVGRLLLGLYATYYYQEMNILNIWKTSWI